MFFRHSRSQDRTSCGRKCASEWQDNARGFPNWTDISSACVTSSTRTKYIGERLPLEASHCVLEYILRLSAITHEQDIVDNHRLVSFASSEIRGVARCFSTCKRIESESRRARPFSSLETLRQIDKADQRRVSNHHNSDRISIKIWSEIVPSRESFLRSKQRNDRFAKGVLTDAVVLLENRETIRQTKEQNTNTNGQRSDSTDVSGDGAHNQWYYRPACSQQEERANESRLSRLFDQVRRVSGGSAKEGGSFVRSIDGRVAKSGGQPEQRRTRRQNVAEVIGASLAGGKFAKHSCNGRANDGPTTARTGKRTGLLALLLQRCNMLQEKVIMNQRNQSTPRLRNPIRPRDSSHAFPDQKRNK